MKTRSAKRPPPRPEGSTPEEDVLAAARDTPLPTFNFIKKLWQLRDEVLQQLGPEGDHNLLQRALLRLQHLLQYLPKLNPDGPPEQRPFACQVQTTIVIVQLGHKFSGHRSQKLFLELVQHLEEHVLRAVLLQLPRPEVLKALSEKRLTLDLDLATTLCLALIVAGEEYDEAQLLAVLRQAQPQLEASAAHLTLLRAEGAGPRCTHLVLENLVAKAQEVGTEEAEQAALAAVLEFGIGPLALPLGLTLLLRCSREPCVRVPALLVMASMRALHVFEKVVDLYKRSIPYMERVLPGVLASLNDDARSAMDLVLHGAKGTFELHESTGEVRCTLAPDLLEPRPEPAPPGWMQHPPAAVAPDISSASEQRQVLWVPSLNQVLWEALQLPEEGLADHLRPSWPHLRRCRRRLILRLLTEQVMAVSYSSDTQRKLQLELSAIQTLLEFGPDCLNLAEQLELMIASSCRPFLQARLAAAWIRLSPQRRQLLPRLLSLLPGCRSRRAHTDVFIKYLPDATKSALEDLIKRAIAAVPTSVCAEVNVKTAGVSGAQLIGMHHVTLWRLAWRPAKRHEGSTVFGHVVAVFEPPDCEAAEDLAPEMPFSILMDAPQLLDEMQLLEETKRLLPLVDKESAYGLLEVLASRAAKHLVDMHAEFLSTPFVDQTYQLILERGHCFLSLQDQLQLLLLSCPDPFCQAELLTLWVRLSPQRRLKAHRAVEMLAMAIQWKKPVTQSYLDFKERIIGCIPEDTFRVITEEECREAYEEEASSMNSEWVIRCECIEMVWWLHPVTDLYWVHVLDPIEGVSEVEDYEDDPAWQFEDDEQTPAGKLPVPEEFCEPPAKKARTAKKSKKKLFSEQVGPEPEPAQEPPNLRQLQPGKSKKRKANNNNPTTNKPQVVPGPEVLPPQLDAPSAEEPVVLLPKKRAAKSTSTKADGPAGKKPKVSKAPEAPLRRSSRRAAHDATEAIARCYEAFDLRRRPPSWMISGGNAALQK